MSVYGRDVPYQRLGDRAQVTEPAAIAIEQPRRFRGSTEMLVPVVIRDVSVSGALLSLPGDMRPDIGLVVDLIIDGDRGAVRVRRTTAAEGHLVGVEFIDPHPAFLPTIYHWLGREAALGKAGMR